MHSTGTGQPVETQDVFFWRLAGRTAPTGLANCPLDRVLTYKNLIYLLNLQISPETLLHLFYHCNKSQIIWNELKSWIQNEINFTMNIQPKDIMLGYFNKDQYFLPINTIIMVTKKFLFKNSRKGIPHIFKNLQEDVKNVYVEQKLVAI